MGRWPYYYRIYWPVPNQHLDKYIYTLLIISNNNKLCHQQNYNQNYQISHPRYLKGQLNTF